jgi:hypothetical protein
MATHVCTGSSQPLVVIWRTNVKFTSLLASVALASVTSAQVSVEWVATHDAPSGGNNHVSAVAVDATGRVAVGGHTYGSTSSGGDYATCLYGSDGALIWSRSENLNDSNWCSAVAFDGTGGLYVAGWGEQHSAPWRQDRTLLHYDAVGNLLWSNTQLETRGGLYPTHGGYALAPCPNGDLILAGSLTANLSLERFDPAGNLLWSWTSNPNTGAFNHLTAVTVGPGGDIWATGAISNGNYDIVVVRVTSAGVPVWIRELNSNHQVDSGRALVVDAAGNVTVAGSMGGNAVIARWNSAGNLVWQRTYGDTAHVYDYATQIALDPFGRIVAAGRLWNSVTRTDFAVWCLDTAGNLIWQRTWDGPFGGDDWFGDLVVDAMGAVWLSGASRGSGSAWDLTIASWDSTGAFRWSWLYPGAGLKTTRYLGFASQYAGVAAVSGNNVIVTGSVKVGAQRDALILKLNRTAVEYCFGDGSSSSCPCANASAPEQHAGCANALGLGARLVDEGASSLASDTLVLVGSQMPDGNALYFQGTSSTSGGAGEPFGDGLSCVGGTLIRLRSKTNVAGASQFPDVGDASVSVRGLVTSPGTRTYQAWYRDASTFCTTANFNFSNGLLITWTL